MPKNVVKFAISLALLMVAYIPTIAWMMDRWFAEESYYSHGPLIPLIALFFIWQRKDVLAKAIYEGQNSRAAGLGLWAVGLGLLVHIACAALKVYFISGFSMVVVIYGLILFFFGKEFAMNLIFPVFFLLAMIPLPLVLIGNLVVSLKLFATQGAVFVLNHIGFPCVQDGSIIRMPKSFTVVEAPCSGLRSLISLLTLGLIFAYAMKVSYIKKAIIFLSSIPIAIATNMVRIVMISAVNDLYGEKVAMGFFHDFTGLVVFALAFAGLYGVGSLLKERVK